MAIWWREVGEKDLVPHAALPDADDDTQLEGSDAEGEDEGSDGEGSDAEDAEGPTKADAQDKEIGLQLEAVEQQAWLCQIVIV